MFDEKSFSTASFDTRSWWFGLVDTARRYIFRLSSKITRVVSKLSGIY